MIVGFIGMTISDPWARLARIPSKIPDTAVICGPGDGAMNSQRRSIQ